MMPLRMATLLFFLSILFYWFQPTIQFLSRRRFLKQARFVIDVLHQLSVTPFHIYNVSDSFDCTLKCIEHDQCLSFNIAFISAGRFKVCHLLSTDKYNSSSDLRPSKYFHYHSIDIGLRRGELNPCTNGGTLIPLYWTGDHNCSYPPPNIIRKQSEWIQLNSYPVHIESKDGKFGTFKAIKSGQILKFKLVHISGGMSCSITKYKITKFGCGPNLALIITDTSNHIVFPNPRLLQPNPKAGYSLPGVTSDDSEVILPEIDPPLHVTAGQAFRVWYSDDLFNGVTSNNIGTLDIDVHAFYD